MKCARLVGTRWPDKRQRVPGTGGSRPARPERIVIHTGQNKPWQQHPRAGRRSIPATTYACAAPWQEQAQATVKIPLSAGGSLTGKALWLQRSPT